MLTVDYKFYKTAYHGDKISETAWPAAARDAVAFIDKITFGRISDDMESALVQSCKMAVCAAAEEMQVQQSGIVSSATNDGYSETYLVNTPERRLRSVVGLWLDNTGLLYRGCDGC